MRFPPAYSLLQPDPGLHQAQSWQPSHCASPNQQRLEPQYGQHLQDWTGVASDGSVPFPPWAMAETPLNFPGLSRVDHDDAATPDLPSITLPTINQSLYPISTPHDELLQAPYQAPYEERHYSHEESHERSQRYHYPSIRVPTHWPDAYLATTGDYVGDSLNRHVGRLAGPRIPRLQIPNTQQSSRMYRAHTIHGQPDRDGQQLARKHSASKSCSGFDGAPIHDSNHMLPSTVSSPAFPSYLPSGQYPQGLTNPSQQLRPFDPQQREKMTFPEKKATVYKRRQGHKAKRACRDCR